MKKYNLVVNDPYTDPEGKARRSARAAKLLPPKSDEVSVSKKTRNPALKEMLPVVLIQHLTVSILAQENQFWNCVLLYIVKSQLADLHIRLFVGSKQGHLTQYTKNF